MEVEEFNHLSPEVAKERLRRLATKMDRNSDGKMDKSELQVKLENPSFVLHVLIIYIGLLSLFIEMQYRSKQL